MKKYNLTKEIRINYVMLMWVAPMPLFYYVDFASQGMAW